MPEITLTSFVDFVLANGTSRLTELRKIKRRFSGEYDYVADYYRELRQALQQFHRGDTTAPQRAVDGIHQSKKKNYAAIADTHSSFAKNSTILSTFEPPRATWSANGLDVIVNPELGLRFPDGPVSVKLYFKPPEVSKRRADIVLHLMKRGYESRNRAPEVALLDLRRGRLFNYRPTSQNLDVLLAGEAAAFCAMWDLLDKAEA